MKKLLILLVVSVVGCQPRVKTTQQIPQIDSNKLISCEGVGEVKFNLSAEDIMKKFGANVITEHENSIRGKYLSLWENSPKQLNLFWKEKEPPFKTLDYIEIVGEGAPYLTKDSLMVGMTIRDVVKINGGMPVTFNNFELNDENGLIKSFNGGSLEANIPCLSGNFEVVGKRNVSVKDQNEFNRKKQIESFDNMLERIDVSLSVIRVNKKG